MSLRDDWPILLILAALVGTFVLAAYHDATRPTFMLKKADWTCTRSEQHTRYQPMVINNQTQLMPITETVCLEYKRVQNSP